MHLIEGEFYHIYNRGNNKQQIFFNDENYLFFLRKIREQLSSRVDILAYCLMPNHFHMLIRANEKSITERSSFGKKSMQEFAYRVGIMLSSYSQAINKQNNTTGSLFQQKTKAKILAEVQNNNRISYLEECFYYIHQNPLLAGLVTDLSDWPYSSYLDYAGLRNGTLCKKDIFLINTGIEADSIAGSQKIKLNESIVPKLY